MRRNALWAILLLVPLLNGCGTVAAVAFGLGTVGALSGHSGEQGIVKADLERSWSATLETLDEMKCRISVRDKSENVAKVEATTPDQKPVLVTLRSIPDRETHLNVQVGSWEEEVQDRRFFQSIKKKL